ncbi:uncharacterized protein [Triticum aestivum]|uniref:uncharacterized protein n=1 Tax=Triticum aestivum TaxID=4565 RepID=UPI001D02E5A4|nr:uncharacterized protein LOC123052031 [Triticum aestivum]
MSQGGDTIATDFRFLTLILNIFHLNPSERTAATRGRQARDGRILPSPALRPALWQARPPRPGLLAVPPWGPPPPPLVLASAPCIDLLDREPWADWPAEEDLSDAAAAAAGLLPRGRRFGDRLAELVSAMETAQQAV